MITDWQEDFTQLKYNSGKNEYILALAINLPNNDTVFKRDNTGKITGYKNWKQDYLTSIRDLEQITEYDFFSDVS